MLTDKKESTLCAVKNIVAYAVSNVGWYSCHRTIKGQSWYIIQGLFISLTNSKISIENTDMYFLLVSVGLKKGYSSRKLHLELKWSVFEIESIYHHYHCSFLEEKHIWSIPVIRGSSGCRDISETTEKYCVKN